MWSGKQPASLPRSDVEWQSIREPGALWCVLAAIRKPNTL